MFEFPKIMAIVNVTPDSFSDSGKFNDSQFAIEYALKAIEDGADIIDIGGESTRPGSEPISVDEELQRVLPVIEGIRRHNSLAVVSIDTTKSIVAEKAVKAGANIINDISGGTFDVEMFDVASELCATLVIMHTTGTPAIMQSLAKYENVLKEVSDFLEIQILKAEQKGVKEIIIDPGIGFGKLYEHNIAILRNLDYFYSIKKPMLLGISRKSFIGKLLNIVNPQERDTATILLHSILLKYRIDYIRIHDYHSALMLKNLVNEIFLK